MKHLETYVVLITLICMGLLQSCRQSEVKYLYENEDTGNYCVDKNCKRLNKGTVVTHEVKDLKDSYYLKYLCPICVSEDARLSLKAKIKYNHIQEIKQKSGIYESDSFFARSYKVARLKKKTTNIYSYWVLLNDYNDRLSIYNSIKDDIVGISDFKGFSKRVLDLKKTDSLNLGIIKPNDNINKLYKGIRENMALGSEIDFRNKLRSKGYVTYLYNTLVDMGYDDVGDYELFCCKIIVCWDDIMKRYKKKQEIKGVLDEIFVKDE